MSESNRAARAAYQAEQRRWREAARERPARIEPASPGRESVWDYPRPPRVEPVAHEVRVEWAGRLVARTTRALRVVETASPPAYYLPPEDVRSELLVPSERTSFCEWKGVASYFTLRDGARVSPDAAWVYPEPDPEYAAIRGRFAFFAGRVDACYVGAARALPQPGDTYGGWITPELVGPFKGEPGSERW
jgi:uncharacterized protein (DUF427 family)